MGANITQNTSINCTSLVPNYNKATVNNFVLLPLQTYFRVVGGLGSEGVSLGATISKSYNASTGVLSITGVYSSWNNNWAYGYCKLNAYYVDTPLIFG